jgi:hypothetical protein
VLSRNNPAATETPAPYTATGSPAPVCVDVTGRPPILISQRSDSKSATDYTSCILGCSLRAGAVPGPATSSGRLNLLLPTGDGEALDDGCLPVAVTVGEDAR